MIYSVHQNLSDFLEEKKYLVVTPPPHPQHLLQKGSLIKPTIPFKPAREFPELEFLNSLWGLGTE
jgi:hypothetical protein